MTTRELLNVATLRLRDSLLESLCADSLNGQLGALAVAESQMADLAAAVRMVVLERGIATDCRNATEANS